MRKASPQMRLAVEHYVQGSDKKNSMLLAGYSEATASGQQARFFDYPPVRAYLEQRRKTLMKRVDLNEDWVVQRFMRIAAGPETLARFKKVTPDGGLEWDFTGATQAELAVIDELTTTMEELRSEEGTTRMLTRFKVGTTDPKGALDSLARILGAFRDRLDVSGELKLVERIRRGQERARLENRREEDVAE